MPRHDGRSPGDLRPVQVGTEQSVRQSPGSVLLPRRRHDGPGDGARSREIARCFSREMFWPYRASISPRLSMNTGMASPVSRT